MLESLIGSKAASSKKKLVSKFDN